ARPALHDYARTRMIPRVPTVGIIGASAVTGAELLRLCAAHPALDVRVAAGVAQAGRRAAARCPSLAAAYGDLPLEKYVADRCDGLDLVFLALPHGASQQIVPELLGRVGAIVDLAADFRLRDPAAYPRWYGEEHAHPELLETFAYGLPELFRDPIAGATRGAAPGRYVTAAARAAAPRRPRGG